MSFAVAGFLQYTECRLIKHVSMERKGGVVDFRGELGEVEVILIPLTSSYPPTRRHLSVHMYACMQVFERCSVPGAAPEVY